MTLSILLTRCAITEWWVWQGSLKPIWSNPSDQAGLPRAGTVSKWLLNISTERNFTIPSGQPVALFGYPQSRNNVIDIQREPPYFVCACCLWCSGPHWGEPGSVPTVPFLQVFIHIDKISRAFSYLGSTVPALSGLLQWEDAPVHYLHHLCGPSSDSLLYACISFLQSSLDDPCTSLPAQNILWLWARSGHSTPDVAPPVLSRGERSHPLACWQYFF